MKNKTTHQLLLILSDGQFHSGESLGKNFGITRSAIWKHIRELTNMGVEIQSVTGKGYRIYGGIEFLDQAVIRQQLSSENQDRLNELIILESTSSTNDFLIEAAKQHPNKTIACFAERQTAGKGRRGRHWTSPFGTNIYHSLLCHFEKDPAEMMGLSLAISIAITKAIARYGIAEGVSVKWPNDVLWQQQKLAGVLLETIAENHGGCKVIVGIGLNTAMTTLQAKQINQPWTSIAEITQQQVNRNQLAGILLDELLQLIQLFSEKGLSAYIKEWQTLDCLMGKPVMISSANGMIHGIMQGIGEQGELILLNQQNQTQRFFSGEVSVRAES